MNLDQGTINASNNLVFNKKENRIKVVGKVKIIINEKGVIQAQQITIHIDKKGKIEIVEATGQKFFTCNQCHKDYVVVEEDAISIGTRTRLIHIQKLG